MSASEYPPEKNIKLPIGDLEPSPLMQAVDILEQHYHAYTQRIRTLLDYPHAPDEQDSLLQEASYALTDAYLDFLIILAADEEMTIEQKAESTLSMLHATAEMYQAELMELLAEKGVARKVCQFKPKIAIEDPKTQLESCSEAYLQAYMEAGIYQDREEDEEDIFKPILDLHEAVLMICVDEIAKPYFMDKSQRKIYIPTFAFADDESIDISRSMKVFALTLGTAAAGYILRENLGPYVSQLLKIRH